MPTTCPAIIRRGSRRGQVCGRRCRNNSTHCGYHRNLATPINNVIHPIQPIQPN